MPGVHRYAGRRLASRVIASLVVRICQQTDPQTNQKVLTTVTTHAPIRHPRGRRLSALLSSCAIFSVFCAVSAVAQDTPYPLGQIVLDADDDDSGSIVSSQTSAGSKLSGDVLDTAASVSVITQQEITQRGAKSVQEVLQYTSGVVTSFYGADDRFDYFRIRGFDAYAYRDGLYLGDPFGGVREEPYAFERVEVLKGANSAALGVSDPGGAVNYVTKTPKDHRFGDAYLTAGSFNRVEAGVDFGDTLNEQGTLSYRLTGKVVDAEREYDYSQDDETFVMGGVTWAPTDATSLTFVVDYLNKDSVPGSGGHPVGVDLDPSTFLGEPDFNYRGTDRTTASLLFEHDFDGGFSLHSTHRFSATETDFGYAYVAGTDAGGGTMADRYFFANDYTADEYVGDVNVQLDRDFGTVQSRSVVGIERRTSDVDNTSYWALAPDIDWTDPVYTGGIDLSTLTPYAATQTEIEAHAIYLQEELTFADKFIAQLGLRQDWIDVEQVNALSDTVTEGDFEETSKRFGLTYRATPGMSVYGSYAESFVADSLGVEPERGEQYELGVKYRPQNGRALYTASIYDLTKNNITRTDPITSMPETIGEVRVRGLDLEAKAELSDTISLTASYSLMDSEIVENGTSGNEGNALSFVPEQTMSVWARYQLAGAGSRGDMTFGLGAHYDGAYWMDDGNTLKSDPAVIFDAAVTYAVNDSTSLAVNVANLFDERYVAYGGFGSDYYNTERVINATLRRSW
ncbi:iron complex outermembrane receptor protein [Yoonia maritima]|uniref:Iron complex outermembrane receptor protein n=1 Tax=Yoonia maritima TaxID=1435347 RepID=A0A2T0VXA0_9RHOB|nr:iron complex outermembrane receptor protein [Yoonia maritima]